MSLEFAGTDGVVPLSPFLYRVCSGLDGFHPVRFAPASLCRWHQAGLNHALFLARSYYRDRISRVPGAI
jgi:hypothetical protein